MRCRLPKVFRDVAEKLSELFPEQEKNIGTIHTFQGKEADVAKIIDILNSLLQHYHK